MCIVDAGPVRQSKPFRSRPVPYSARPYYRVNRAIKSQVSSGPAHDQQNTWSFIRRRLRLSRPGASILFRTSLAYSLVGFTGL